MRLEHNELVAEVVTARLREARVGVVAAGLSNIAPASIASHIVTALKNHSPRRARASETQTALPLHVAIVGYALEAENTADLSFATDIESAVAWRNRPELGGRIVIFVEGETHKLHSLNDLDSITARDVAAHLLARAETELSNNEPQRRFWRAMRSEATNFPLSMLEDFVRAVAADNANARLIPVNLWRLGLLEDPKALDGNTDASVQLRRNRELIVEMGQLSAESRKRMSAVLVKATGAERTRFRTASR